jgi:RNA polymerase sigma-70 factor (ECF subfamily)
MNADDIVRQVREGDREAFTGIVELYHRELCMMVAYHLRDRALVEDVVQRTYMKAFVNLDRYELGRSFRAWIRGIAKNEAKKELRRMLSARGTAERYADRLAAEQGLAPDAGEDLEQKRVYLQRCMEKLPARTRKILALKYTMEKKVADIAGETQRSLDSVKKILCRSRIALKDCIDKLIKEEVHA